MQLNIIISAVLLETNYKTNFVLASAIPDSLEHIFLPGAVSTTEIRRLMIRTTAAELWRLAQRPFPLLSLPLSLFCVDLCVYTAGAADGLCDAFVRSYYACLRRYTLARGGGKATVALVHCRHRHHRAQQHHRNVATIQTSRFASPTRLQISASNRCHTNRVRRALLLHGHQHHRGRKDRGLVLT